MSPVDAEIESEPALRAELERLTAALERLTAAQSESERERGRLREALAVAATDLDAILAVSHDREAFVMQGMRAWARAERLAHEAVERVRAALTPPPEAAEPVAEDEEERWGLWMPEEGPGRPGWWGQPCPGEDEEPCAQSYPITTNRAVFARWIDAERGRHRRMDDRWEPRPLPPVSPPCPACEDGLGDCRGCGT